MSADQTVFVTLLIASMLTTTQYLTTCCMHVHILVRPSLQLAWYLCFFSKAPIFNSSQFINWDGPLYEDHKEGFAANKRSCKLASVFCFWCCILSRLAQCKYSSSAALHKVLQFATTLSELCHVYDEGQRSILVREASINVTTIAWMQINSINAVEKFSMILWMELYRDSSNMLCHKRLH